MMYNSQRANSIKTKDVAYLDAGIHDNISLISVRTDVSVHGNAFLEFKLADKDGKSVTWTEWQPNRTDNDTDASFDEKCDKQFKRIDQILSCFYPDVKDREFEGEQFKDLAAWVVEKLNAADKNILVRCKVVYNDNGFTTLPKYAQYTFIEPMSKVNEGKSVIVKLGIDRFTRPVVEDVEKVDNNPLPELGTLNNETADPNGLPF